MRLREHPGSVSCKIKSFLSIGNFMKKVLFCKISPKILKKSKKSLTSKNIKNFKIRITACPTMFYRKKNSHKVIFYPLFYLFFSSMCGSFTSKIWLKLYVIKDITKAFPPSPIPSKLQIS